MSLANDELRSIFERLVSEFGEGPAQLLWKGARGRSVGKPPSLDLKKAEARLIDHVVMLEIDRLMPGRPVAAQLRTSFALVALILGQETAQQLWRNAARRPRAGRPGSKNPARDEELLRLADMAINGPNPVQIARLAKLLDEKIPREFGPTAKAVEMKLRRLIARLRKS